MSVAFDFGIYRSLTSFSSSSNKKKVYKVVIQILTEKEKKDSGEVECAICISTFDKVACASINCNHSFCKECLNKWMRANDTCPICRGYCSWVTDYV